MLEDEVRDGIMLEIEAHSVMTPSVADSTFHSIQPKLLMNRGIKNLYDSTS